MASGLVPSTECFRLSHMERSMAMTQTLHTQINGYVVRCIQGINIGLPMFSILL